MTCRILLADDHQLVRQGIRSLLEKEPDLQVVAEAADGREAVDLAGRLSPDLVVMDIGMPNLNGVEATAQILAAGACTKIIALSMRSEVPFVSKMLRAGASGYLLKDCAAEELIEAIRAVRANRTYLSKAIMGVVVEDYRHRITVKDDTPEAVLTSREREILQLLAEGQSAKEIADRLCVSVKTVETHRQHIMEKLDIHSIAGLTKYAIRQGITSPEN